MKVQDRPPLHLTYCLNVHPGETWAENFAAIREKALQVRAQVGRVGAFGLGLRLSHQAAETLAEPKTLDAFRGFLIENGLYVFTINGFPYGRFHGTRVKTDVYRPDWRTPERRQYTMRLADILAALLPEGVCGSISTAPGSYKPWITSNREVAAMAGNLAAVADHLHELYEQTGREIRLALEPEPDCYVQTTPEAIEFLTGPVAAAGQEDVTRRYVGVCFDAAHQAVQFEDLVESLGRLQREGIVVAKIQLSAALCVEAGDDKASLEAFREEVYLHQVRVREADGTVQAYPDLPQALAGREAGRWRVHFHVPLFFEGAGPLRSTADLLDARFFEACRRGATEHLEIETYTFDVLPADLRTCDVTESIAREYRWVLGRL